jgi:hypothetical protein
MAKIFYKYNNSGWAKCLLFAFIGGKIGDHMADDKG